MTSIAKTPDAKPTLHPEFVKNMVRTFDDPDEHGVHMLFNEWWAHAPDATIEGYPKAIVPVMDAISRGWQLGRSVENLQFARWEDAFEEPLATVRPRYGLPPEGVSTQGA
jgi:hypothetical protein